MIYWAVHLQNAIDYYEGLTSGLGDAFFEEFENHILSICQNPWSYAIRFADVRFAVIKRFKHALYYSINEPAREVVIFALYSGYVNPDTHWKKPDNLE